MPATRVPETRRTRKSAIEAGRSVGMRRLIVDSVERFRAADGFAFVRSLAFQMTLTAIPLFIAFVGLATALGEGSVRQAMKETMLSLTPGEASQTVTQAFQQGSQAAKGSSTALWFGSLAALASYTTAMVYVERGSNRIYGIEEDRPVVERYGRALALALSSGFMILVAFVLFMAGSSVGKIAGPDGLWIFLRWPAALAALLAGFVIVLRFAPNRNQPSLSWLLTGGTFGAFLWSAFTGLLTIYLTVSRGFGKTYGPLAGVIGMLLWSFLGALAIFLAVSFTAQLETVGAGRKEPSRPG